MSNNITDQHDGLENKPEIPESKQAANNTQPKETKTGHHAGNILQATFQKMFHMDHSEKSKSLKASSATGSESEDEPSESSSSQVLDNRRSQVSSARPAQIRSSNVPKPRFQKNTGGSHAQHAHNLQSCRKVHRMHNILKELGIGHAPAEDKPEYQINTAPEKTPFKHVYSEASLSEKYGKPQEIIGKGAFGIVRIAHKTEPKVPGERLFAVKEFKKRSNEPPKKYIKRLTSEFCISSSLHHVNIIDTLDLLQDTQGNYCEVMEYCAGGDLYSLIVASGGLEQDEANCFFGQLINGVKYLHDNGVAHRDLKPENLLLTSHGCLKITDFGNGECFRMAWETQAHMTRGICGSEPYIAPEEYIEDWFDPRLVDVWACGIIYMGMVTGRHLWRIAKEREDCNFKVYLESRAQGEYLAPFQRLTNGQRRIMSRIIEPNPKHRITAEQIIEDPWFTRLVICNRSPLATNVSKSKNMSCAGNIVEQQSANMNKVTVSNIV